MSQCDRLCKTRPGVSGRRFTRVRAAGGFKTQDGGGFDETAPRSEHT